MLQAANWLRSNSNLYKDEGVIFDSDWIHKYNYYNVENDSDVCDINLEDEPQNENRITELLHDDEWSEDETEAPAGVTDTMLTTSDFSEDNERQHICNVAPAVGNIPLHVFRDK